MSNLKIIILSVAVLIMLSMLLLVAQFILRKLKNAKETTGADLSSGVWLMGLLLPGVLLISRTIAVFAEAIDIHYKTDSTHALLNNFKTGSLLTGLTLVWLMVWYYVSNTLSMIITGKRNVNREAETGNYVYFLIRAAVLTGFIFCLLPVFEAILNVFIPHIEMPFYH